MALRISSAGNPLRDKQYIQRHANDSAQSRGRVHFGTA